MFRLVDGMSIGQVGSSRNLTAPEVGVVVCGDSPGWSGVWFGAGAGGPVDCQDEGVSVSVEVSNCLASRVGGVAQDERIIEWVDLDNPAHFVNGRIGVRE